MTPLLQLRTHLQQSPLPRRLWTGAYCVAQGVLMTLRSPALLRLALIPVAINLALYPLAGYGAWQLIGPIHALLFPWTSPSGFWALPFALLSGLLWLVIAAVTGVTALLLVNAVGSTMASPFLDAVSQRAEALLTRETVPTGPSVVEGVLRAMKMQGALLLVYLPLTLACAVVSLVPVVGFLVGPAAQAVITVMFMCIQMMDWPAERRRLGLRDRLTLMRTHKAACLGFGAACWVMMVFPFTLPFGAAGGTLLFVGLQSQDPTPT
jgi:CysZ protein